MSEQRYIDPNSGAAPQPGGYANAPVQSEESQGGADEVRDPTYDATIETQAAPGGDQPGGTSGEADGGDQTGDGGNPDAGDGASPAGDGASPDGDGADTPSGDDSSDYSELLDKNVPEIQEYIDEHPEEKDAIIAAEQDRAGDDARKGIVEY